MNSKKFFAELKRRNIYKVAIAYGVVTWLLMQIASQIFPFFEIPNWAIRLVIMLIVIGFPIALVIACARRRNLHKICEVIIANDRGPKPSRGPEAPNVPRPKPTWCEAA